MQLMTHVWDKLCGFIYYNVQYVVFIVAYDTLDHQFDIREWHIWYIYMCYFLMSNYYFNI